MGDKSYYMGVWIPAIEGHTDADYDDHAKRYYISRSGLTKEEPRTSEQFESQDEVLSAVRGHMANDQKINQVFIISRDGLSNQLVNNWIFLLVVGMVSLVFSVYYTLALVDFFTADTGGVFYVEEFFIPIGTLLIGGFLLYISLQNGTMLIVSYSNNRKRLSLEQLRKSGQLQAFVREVGAITKAKNKVVEMATHV